MKTTTKILSAIKTLGLPALVMTVWLLEIHYSSKYYNRSANNAKKTATINFYGKATPIGSPSTTLNQLLGNNPDQSSKCGRNPQMKVWIAPYRQFPEVSPEGDSRGLGDYEYLGLLTSDRCASYKINYGAFKNSPADVIFSKASASGLSEELTLARQLGYEWFILDLNKIWLGSENLISECEASAHCRVTSDNFVAISIKQSESVLLFGSLLTTTARRLNRNIQDLMGDLLIDRTSQWHGIEIQNDGSALAWSKSSRIGDSLEFGGIKIKSLPANTDVIMLPSPSAKNVTLQLDCADGKKQELYQINSAHSIGSKLRSCQPDSIVIKDFTLVSSAMRNGNSSEIPQLGPSDTRLSVFGIMVIEK